MPASILSLPAPAKINLFLHVCGRRSDGYHELQTVFQFLEIADRITFSLRTDGQIHLSTHFPGITEGENLIVRAAKAIRQASSTSLGVDIAIEKILPMGGGIGGGSSNAATTLIALNQLWQLHMSKTSLRQIGLALGADVPVFIHGHAAWAEGVGERLTDMDIPEQWYLLAIPDCHVSTAAIFSHPELTRNSKMLKMAAFLEPGGSALFHNDCEPLVRKLYPEVDHAFTLLSGFGNARMTGTGACVFSSFDTEEAASEALASLGGRCRALVSKGANRSPLLRALEQQEPKPASNR
jgi:4-diphosphocytidyl-2-C-methyl-D-erythritol kinase